MITVSILLIFSGSFILYNTSKKVALSQNSALEKWVQTNPKPSKAIGVLLLVIALIIAMYKLEVTSGIMLWLISVMTILSLIIVLYPLKAINYKYLSVLLVVLFILETINI